MASVKVVIRRMKRKDGNANYVLETGNIAVTQYNPETGTQTMTRQEYRRITLKK